MKRQHPIRKIVNLLNVECMHWMSEEDLLRREKLLARHIKPLLDALELEHEGDMVGCRCSTCRLLAEWMKPL